MSYSNKRVVAILLVLTFAVSACGGAKKASTQLDNTYAPTTSLVSALNQMLTDEQKSDHTASFKLLSPDSRKTYKDAADWASHRSELPAITAFHLDSANGSDEIATVEHQPGLDPFVGLSAARDTQTWTGHKFKGGWLLDAEPQIVQNLPDDSRAPAAVKAWAEAVQSCNKDAAHALQTDDDLLGTATPTLCQVAGAVTVGSANKLTEGPSSADIVAQYSSDALNWARVVTVTSPVSVNVVVAPIGNDWKVLSLY